MSVVRTPIIDKNGKATHVLKRADSATSPNLPTGAPQASVMTRLEPLRSFGFEKKYIDAFTDGDCWVLAFLAAELDGFSPVSLTRDADGAFWYHCGAINDAGQVVDIEGVWELETWIERWDDSFFEDEHEGDEAFVQRFESNPEFEEYIAQGVSHAYFRASEQGPELIKTIAEAIGQSGFEPSTRVLEVLEERAEW